MLSSREENFFTIWHIWPSFSLFVIMGLDFVSSDTPLGGRDPFVTKVWVTMIHIVSCHVTGILSQKHMFILFILPLPIFHYRRVNWYYLLILWKIAVKCYLPAKKCDSLMSQTPVSLHIQIFFKLRKKSKLFECIRNAYMHHELTGTGEPNYLSKRHQLQ